MEKNVKLVYNAQLSTVDNMNRLFVEGGVKKEFLDEIDISFVKSSTASEFDKYTDKVGNTALGVNFNGALVTATGYESYVWFYDRIEPIPETWRNKTMLVRDSELENTTIVEYIKKRFYDDGYYFLNEPLTYVVDHTSGNLIYGRNTVNIHGAPKSYIFTGVGKLAVQYLVDLKAIQAKVVTVFNPFLVEDRVVRHESYIVANIVPRANEEETWKAALDRFLIETYGLRRTAAIHSEMEYENLTMKRDTDFRNHMISPVTEEHQLEAQVIKHFKSAEMYKLNLDQVADERSKTVGNLRMIVVKQELPKMLADSGEFKTNEEIGYLYREQKVRSFIFDTVGKEIQVRVQLGEFTDHQVAEQAATNVLKAYFGKFAHLLTFERRGGTGTDIDIVALPNEAKPELTKYLTGELTVKVTYSNPDEHTVPMPDNTKDLIKLNRNLPGFSLVAPGATLPPQD